MDEAIKKAKGLLKEMKGKPMKKEEDRNVVNEMDEVSYREIYGVNIIA